MFHGQPGGYLRLLMGVRVSGRLPMGHMSSFRRRHCLVPRGVRSFRRRHFLVPRGVRSFRRRHFLVPRGVPLRDKRHLALLD